tara:strand:- start:88 stop:312 length:225 start_codon:yes stop_codon:yes gene_type:complete
VADSRLVRRWLSFSIGGLICIGAGVSIVGQAIIAKGAGEAWFWMGTAGLVVLNAGVSVFGQGVVYRVLLVRDGR